MISFDDHDLQKADLAPWVGHVITATAKLNNIAAGNKRRPIQL